MDILQSGYILQPRLTTKQINWQAAFIYQFLCYYASREDGYKGFWKRGQVVTNNAAIKDAILWSDHQIRKSIDDLIEYGMITKESLSGKRGTIYTIIHFEQTNGNVTNKPRTNREQLTTNSQTSHEQEESTNSLESDTSSDMAKGAHKQVTNKSRTSHEQVTTNSQHYNKELRIKNEKLTKNDDTQLSGVPEVSFKYTSLTATSQQWSKANEAIVLAWIDDGFSERQVVAAITLGAVRAHEAGVTTINSVKYFDKTLRNEIADADEDYIDYLLMDRSEHGPLLDAVTASGLQKEN